MNLHPPEWLGSGLIEVTLKALLVVVVAGCLTVALRKATASRRHAIWLAAIVLLITLPIAAFTLPQFSLPLLPAEPIVANSMTPTVFPPDVSTLAASPPEASSDWALAISLFVDHWSTFALVVWATGFFLLTVRAVVGLIRLERLRRGAKEVNDAMWRRLVGVAQKQSGVQREVRLLVSPQLRTPITWGLRQIYVCLPAHSVEWTLENRRIVLSHELTHARRADWLWQWLTVAMTAVHWFNPLAWWAAHRLRMEAEISCDDEVIKRGCAPSDYADCLYQMVRAAKAAPLQLNAAIPMARPSELPARMARILDDGTKRHDSSFRALVVTLALSMIAGSVFAAAQAVRAQPEIDDADSIALEFPSAVEDGAESNPSEAGQELEEEIWGSEYESSKLNWTDAKREGSPRWIQEVVASGVLTPGESKKAGLGAREERVLEASAIRGPDDASAHPTALEWFRSKDTSDASYLGALEESGLDADQIEIAIDVIWRILETKINEVDINDSLMEKMSSFSFSGNQRDVVYEIAGRIWLDGLKNLGAR